MGQRISKDQVSYRRKELKWIKFFHHLETLLIIFLLFNYFAMCFLYELDSTDFPLYYLPIAIQYEVNFILTIFCFVFLSKLMYSMFKLHRQEFQRVKYNLITEMVFFCALLAQGIFINYQLVEPLINDFIKYKTIDPNDPNKKDNYSKVESLNISAFIAEMMQINSVAIICYILIF